jgi:hypothetical protein
MADDVAVNLDAAARLMGEAALAGAEIIATPACNLAIAAKAGWLFELRDALKPR